MKALIIAATAAALVGVLALPGAVAILALDGFVPKEQLAAPVIGDISRLRETVDELRRRFGAAGREITRTRFSVATMAAEMEAFYLRSLAERRGR